MKRTSNWLFLILCLLSTTRAFTQALLDLTYPQIEPDSHAKIPELKRMLIGTWNLEKLGDYPVSEVYYIKEDSIDKISLTFWENGIYESSVVRAGKLFEGDSGRWDIWYFNKGTHWDTIFYADGFYLKFHSVYADSLSEDHTDYPEEIVKLDDLNLVLQWECYCGMASPMRTFRKEITWPDLRPYHPVDGPYFREDESKKRLDYELDSITKNLVGIWKERQIGYDVRWLSSEPKRIKVTDRKRKKWNKNHDTDYGSITYTFNDDGTYLMEHIRPGYRNDYWSFEGQWRVFADSSHPETKYVEFYNRRMNVFHPDDPGYRQDLFPGDTCYELSGFFPYSHFWFNDYPGYLGGAYFERMPDDLIYIPQAVAIARRRDGRLLNRLVLSDAYYNEDENTWHLRFFSLAPDCYPCEYADFVIDATSGKIIERNVQNNRR